MKAQRILHITHTEKGKFFFYSGSAILLLGMVIVLWLCLQRSAAVLPVGSPAGGGMTAEGSSGPQPVTEYIRMSDLVSESSAADTSGSLDISEISDSSSPAGASGSSDPSSPADASVVSDSPSPTDASGVSDSSSPAGASGSSDSASQPDAPKVYDTLVTSKVNGKANSYNELSVPTWLTKVGNTYFLVDCYHNQVIYNDNLTDQLSKWKVMTDDIDRGHTLASDGTVYLIDDTERNRVLVFEKKDGGYAHTQIFENIGTRPHYIIYHAPTDTFYAWSSMTGEMYLFRHNPDDTRMYLTEIRRIDALDNVYVRSFTIIGNDIYFVSGNSTIIRADLKSFKIRETYPVPDDIAGMIQLTRIQDYYYITVSTDIAGNQSHATILRTRNLSSLAKGEYEDIYKYFIGGGTPYYITESDNTYYLTEHRLPGHSLWRFQVEKNEIVNVETVY